jgi:hypothetical protein
MIMHLGADHSGQRRVRRIVAVTGRAEGESRPRRSSATGSSRPRVERQVLIVREHVLAGRSFDSLEQLEAAFAAWLPIRRAQIHRAHGQVISVRAARDRTPLAPLPAHPYVLAERFLRPGRMRLPGHDLYLMIESGSRSLNWFRPYDSREPASGARMPCLGQRNSTLPLDLWQGWVFAFRLGLPYICTDREGESCRQQLLASRSGFRRR